MGFTAKVYHYPGKWNFGTNLNQWAIVTWDWNGDGKTDFMRISPTYTHPFISKGDGTFTAKVYHYPGKWNFGTNLNQWAIVTGDWNGDGKTDFMRIRPTYTHPFISKGDGTITAKVYHYPKGWNFGTSFSLWSITVGDFNGDGKTDFMRVSPTYTHAFISKGDGTFTAKMYHYPKGWNFGKNLNQWAIVVGDWDGDGKKASWQGAQYWSQGQASTQALE